MFVISESIAFVAFTVCFIVLDVFSTLYQSCEVVDSSPIPKLAVDHALPWFFRGRLINHFTYFLQSFGKSFAYLIILLQIRLTLFKIWRLQACISSVWKRIVKGGNRPVHFRQVIWVWSTPRVAIEFFMAGLWTLLLYYTTMSFNRVLTYDFPNHGYYPRTMYESSRLLQFIWPIILFGDLTFWTLACFGTVELLCVPLAYAVRKLTWGLHRMNENRVEAWRAYNTAFLGNSRPSTRDRSSGKPSPILAAEYGAGAGALQGGPPVPQPGTFRTSLRRTPPAGGRPGGLRVSNSGDSGSRASASGSSPYRRVITRQAESPEHSRPRSLQPARSAPSTSHRNPSVERNSRGRRVVDIETFDPANDDVDEVISDEEAEEEPSNLPKGVRRLVDVENDNDDEEPTYTYDPALDSDFAERGGPPKGVRRVVDVENDEIRYIWDPILAGESSSGSSDDDTEGTRRVVGEDDGIPPPRGPGYYMDVETGTWMPIGNENESGNSDQEVPTNAPPPGTAASVLTGANSNNNDNNARSGIGSDSGRVGRWVNDGSGSWSRRQLTEEQEEGEGDEQ